MKLNMFEGGRRIALLIGGLWAIGCVAYAVFAKPSTVSVTYEIREPELPPVFVEECTDDVVKEYVSPKTANGERVNVVLCFIAARGMDGNSFWIETGNRIINKEYSAEVTRYMKAVSLAFQLDARGIKEVTERKRAAMLEQWKDAMLFLFGGLAVGWALITATGWIARGFMGIPRGKDERPSG